MCVGTGREDLLVDTRFTTMTDRAEHREALYAILDAVFLTQTTRTWVERLDAVGAAAAPVNSIDQVFEDPQVLARDMLQSVTHSTLGEIPQVGHAQKLHGTPNQITLPPPVLGEHTREVLSTVAGYSDTEIKHLADERAIVLAVEPTQV
jgi:formyl-CoA transferase/succinate--hydroxymethylglutarate CoA-transferase